MTDHGPARWTGEGKRSVQARDTSKPAPAAAPETGTSVEVDATDKPASAKSDKGSSKTGD